MFTCIFQIFKIKNGIDQILYTRLSIIKKLIKTKGFPKTNIIHITMLLCKTIFQSSIISDDFEEL